MAELPAISTNRFAPSDILEIWWIGNVVHRFRGYGNGACVKVAKRLGLSVGTVATFHRLRVAYELTDIEDISLPWSAVRETLGIRAKDERPKLLRDLDQQYRTAAAMGPPLSVRQIQGILKPLK